MRVDDLATPALLVDPDLMAANIATMMGRLLPMGVHVRPHLKTAKSPDIARLLRDAGAHGFCVATLSEAEALAAAGIDDLLITSEIADAPKLSRLAALHRRHPAITVVIDSLDGARLLHDACAGNSQPIGVLIELNVGQNRCGVAPGAAALALAQAIAPFTHVRLIGLQGYEGHLQHVASPAERTHRVDSAMHQLADTAALLRAAGFAVQRVTTGGTGTCERCAQHAGITEVQPGSFVFFDAAYRTALGPGSGYAQALVVLATVISRPTSHRAVIDAGLKAVSTDMGYAEAVNLPGVRYRPGGDEHGILEWDDREGDSLVVGTRIALVPSHIDTTVNLYNGYDVIRGDTVIAHWPIISHRTSHTFEQEQE